MALDAGGDLDVACVGGKAASLMRMARSGLPVPPGLVLTADFFDPWWQRVRADAHWQALLDGSEAAETACPALQTLAAGFQYQAAQRATLDALGVLIARWGGDHGVAVRSSSPHEDLHATSFAGIYRSVLGVSPADVPDAVRGCFAGALDARVVAYKAAHAMDLADSGIAVLVQVQIESRVAGVAFSVNPDTNDHDEVLISAGPGLGDAVVDGTVDADHLVVRKQTGELIEQRRGEREGPGPDSFGVCLDVDRTRALTSLVSRVEGLFGYPVDVEWAVSDTDMVLLQARPITRYFPVPPEFATAPGERRLLFADSGIDQGLTINAPISAMGMDVLEVSLQKVMKVSFGLRSRPGQGLLCISGSRMYLYLSPLLYLQKPARLAANVKIRMTNAILGDILRDVDRDAYRTRRFPARTILAALRMVPGALGLVARVPLALLAPARFAAGYERNNAMLDEVFAGGADDSRPLADFMDHYGAVLSRVLRRSTFPALAAALMHSAFSVQRMAKRASDADRELLSRLELGMSGDPVIEMDLAIWAAASKLPRASYDDLDGLAGRVGAGEVPADFLAAWRDLLGRFGHRGPDEMDVRNPRFQDNPRLLLAYMKSMAEAGAAFDPAAAFQRQVAQRRTAHEALMARSSRRRRRRLARIAWFAEAFGSARNLAKHQIVQYVSLVRRRLLLEGERLTAERYLDAPDDVFDLTLADVQGVDPSGLRQTRDRNRAKREFLQARVTQFPLVVDSRGRILRPQSRPVRPGELQGHGVSPGIARGRVRVLHRAEVADAEPGDVIVAYVTDPGWTPLFVNAAAVVLEIGGAIQHGALVARELGKPCVVGISRATERLRDGDEVEVDGGRGIVTLLSSPARGVHDGGQQSPRPLPASP